ncbi:hypothetical protein ACLKA7_001899, partial [Drosophila subpalustris]
MEKNRCGAPCLCDDGRWNILTLLQERSRWTSTCSNIQQGTFGVNRRGQHTPGQWALGRVHEVHTGADGAVRVVTLKTKTGFSKRNVYEDLSVTHGGQKSGKFGRSFQGR